MDGKMIDVASAERCRRTLDRAYAIADMNRRKKRLLETPTPWRKDSEQLLQIPRSAEEKRVVIVTLKMGSRGELPRASSPP